MHKHYILVTFKKANTFAYDMVDKKDQEMKQALLELKASKVPFTHRVKFSNGTSFKDIVNAGECEWQQIKEVNSIKELINCAK